MVHAQGAEPLFSDQVIQPATWSGPLIVLKDGSVLFVCETNGDMGGVWGRKSTDGGRTWSEPYLFEPAAGLEATMCQSFLRLSNGNLLMSEDIQNAGEDLWSDRDDERTYVRQSSDEGKTWSYPMCATMYPGPWGTNNAAMRQLSTGRLLMPQSVGVVTPVGKVWVSLCVYSDNGGYTWWRSQNYVQIPESYETGEPEVVELAEGRLLMLVRTRLGYMARSYSSDHGETWSPGELVRDLPASIPSPLALDRLPTTGDLVCLWCRNPYGARQAMGEEVPLVPVGSPNNLVPQGTVRSPLSSAISSDGGQTWGHIRDLTEAPSGVYSRYGYPCLCFLDQGKTMLMDYVAGGSVHVARISVDWFYGK
jgi:sialidase-1